MLRVNSTDEILLHELIVSPDLPGEMTLEVREAARRIRDFFVKERGWSHEQLSPYRFRDLMALSEPGEVRLCRTAGRVGWSKAQDDLVLHLTLRELKGASSARRGNRLRAITGEDQVGEVLYDRKLSLSIRDWDFIERLVRERFGAPKQKGRETGAELAEGIRRLLEDAYGR